MKDQFKLPEFKIDHEYNTFTQTIGWNIADLNIPELWKKTQGEGVTIGVIDTGLPTHPDIAENAIKGKSFIKNESIDDKHGHQTHCVGIISAKNNEIGMVGVAPKSKCLCVKGLSNKGSGSSSSIAQAIEYCVQQNVDIISMSLGAPTPNPLIQSAVRKAYQKNIPIICAAGNSGFSGVNYPAAFEECIAVAAYSSDKKIAYFSSRGKEVEIAAPGVRIFSTYLDGKYASLSGTSMACPFVAGVVALMISDARSQGKTLSIKDIRDSLRSTADDMGEAGRDNDWGYGIIDADELVSVKKPEPEPEPDPKPEPEPAPKPEPEPAPKPEPEPDPKPEPEPDPIKKPWLTPRVTWIVFAVMLSVILTALGLSYCSEETKIPNPPYIDENGNIDWDRKLKEDLKK